MAVEVDELYSSLNKLLNDICKFLTDETNYHKLSPYARKQADELIGRSKKQLQEIAKISDENGAYVDMERKSDDNEDDDIYSSIETPAAPQTVAQPPLNPYLELPAKELSHDIKYGTLYWKCKIILNFEKKRRIFAGVHGNWFLIYSTEKDQKPMQSFYLKHYKTQAITSKQKKNLPQDFELVCTENSKEISYYFIASTYKDMVQWTTRINQCYSALNMEINNPNDNIPESNVIPEVKASSIQEEEEDEIYHEIESYVPEQKTTVNKPPDLPIRSVKMTTISQQESSSSSSVSSTYDMVISPEEAKSSSRESVSSFSNDDEEEIYDELCCLETPQVNGVKIEEKIEEKKEEEPKNALGSVLDRVKILEKPKPLVKPKILSQKPKTFGLL